MPETPDDVIYASPPMGRRWMIPGGEEDEASVTLHVVVTNPNGDTVRKYAIMVPIMVTGLADLQVGTPQVMDR